jgi:hypothetical protein
MPTTRSPAPSSSTTAANSNINPALQQQSGALGGNGGNGVGGSDAAVSSAQQTLSNLQLGHMDSAQILALLRHLPGVFNKVSFWF